MVGQLQKVLFRWMEIVQTQNIIANTRRHYFSTEAENEYNTNFLYLNLLLPNSYSMPKSAVRQILKYTFLQCTKQCKQTGKGRPVR